MSSIKLFKKLELKGWVHLEAGENDFDSIAHSLGEVVSRSDIRVTEGSNQFIHSAGHVEYHTDDPRADFILWNCLKPATVGGENLVKDLTLAYKQLDSDAQEQLQKLSFLVDLPGAPVEVPCVKKDKDSHTFYYAPWKAGSKRSCEEEEALFMLTLALSKVPAEPVLLKEREILILDNRRFVHGRGPYEGNQRHLERVLVRKV